MPLFAVGALGGQAANRIGVLCLRHGPPLAAEQKPEDDFTICKDRNEFVTGMEPALPRSQEERLQGIAIRCRDLAVRSVRSAPSMVSPYGVQPSEKSGREGCGQGISRVPSTIGLLPLKKVA